MSESLFGNATPANTNQSNGAPGITTATRIKFAAAGTVTAIRWWCPTTAPAAAQWIVVGYVFATDSAGSGLGSGTFGALTPGAWNTSACSITVAAGDEIVVEVWNSEGRYVNTLSTFTTTVTVGNLIGTAEDAVTPRFNGRFNVGGAIAYPTSGFSANGYFVDVVFEVATSAQPIVVTPRSVRQQPITPAIMRSSLADVVVATATSPQPLVVVPPRSRTVVTQPIIGRSTLVDPPVLTTPQPIVVMPARRIQQPVGPIALRGSLMDLATPQPYVVTPSPRRMLTAPPIVLRSSLADVVVPTGTPGPIVVVPPRRRIAAATVVMVTAPVVSTPPPVIGDRPEYVAGTPYTTWRVSQPYIGWSADSPATSWRATAPRGG